jgi:major membrane immunogen (membrane-anchored lipoprotein)
VKVVFCAMAAAILLSGCSHDDKAPVSTANGASSEEIVKKNCADPKWKEQNLGLWYSVCRQPLRW